MPANLGPAHVGPSSFGRLSWRHPSECFGALSDRLLWNFALYIFTITDSGPAPEFLDGHNPDPETKRVMGIAFEMARVALRLAGRGDLANEIIARRIIELAGAGERDPDLLCEGVLKQFREQRL